MPLLVCAAMFAGAVLVLFGLFALYEAGEWLADRGRLPGWCYPSGEGER